PTLKTAYQMTSPEAARRRFGLPMSEPQRFGPYLSQRFERGALQLWLDAVKGMPDPGTVTVIQVGDLLKDANLVPAPAIAPQSPPAPRPAVVEQPKPVAVPVVAPPAPGGERSVLVNLSRQWWYAYQDGQVAFNGPVTTGMPELATPTGT